jgi:hypothetical protein
MVGVLALLVAVSCGSGDQSTAEDTDESASAVGSEDAGDLGDLLLNIDAGGGGEDLTPLLMRVLAPPEPVKGSDGESFTWSTSWSSPTPRQARRRSSRSRR